jgi:predicted GNAT family acetyltransferase
VSDAPEITFVDVPEAKRYEAHRGDELVGFAGYRLRPGLIAFVHTEVDERFEGHGLGSRLVSFALDDARARGLDVLPFCRFFDGYIKEHREYVDLVPEGLRAHFDL